MVNSTANKMDVFMFFSSVISTGEVLPEERELVGAFERQISLGIDLVW